MSSFWTIVVMLAIGSLFSWFKKKIGAWEQEYSDQQEEQTPPLAQEQHDPYRGVEYDETPQYPLPFLSPQPTPQPPSVSSKVQPEMALLAEKEEVKPSFDLFEEEETEQERIRFLRRAIIMKEVLDRKY